MKELQLLIIVLEKGIGNKIYNDLEIYTIQDAVQKLQEIVTTKEDIEDENKDN
ncbi:hypothetical protein MM236_01140 [Belliella sp. DSM 107340]|uniref:Uncharacterized protein n=1 Tax=Belliella calami TaxID=2923436 RepID=A0ABS9UIY5_9BACT|nr:hypothetical protein [Belliella calami]MCH7396566.1 hypothetical protein [Belliella calami]